MSLRPIVPVACALAVAVPGCMGCWLPAVDVDRPRHTLEELRDREQEHADACAGWSTLDDPGDEPDRYVDDVYGLTGDMVDACADVMAAGQIDRDEYDDVDEMRVRLRVEVDGHRGRIEVVVDVDRLHGECGDHHQQMLDLFDETEARLAAGGIMGGGMMGGSMM